MKVIIKLCHGTDHQLAKWYAVISTLPVKLTKLHAAIPGNLCEKPQLLTFACIRLPESPSLSTIVICGLSSVHKCNPVTPFTNMDEL